MDPQVTPNPGERVNHPVDGGSAPASRDQFQPRDAGGNRKLIMMIGVMLAVGVLIWLAYAATGQMNQRETPRPVSSSNGSIAPLRIDQAPKPIPAKDTGDPRYTQLLAMMQERFASYDKLLAARPREKAEGPVASVVFQSSSPFRGNARAPSLPSGEESMKGLIDPALSAEQSRPDTGIDDLLKPSVLTGEKAGKTLNRNFLLAQGASLECVLETALDTSVPGMTTCVLSRDIYSESAKVLLLEKGSKLVGEYRNSMRNGMRRLFVIWNRVVTPHGVAIKLASPGTDTLGRAGVDGFLDNRYFERFGTALLFSIIADTIPAVVEAGVSRATTDESVELQMTGSAGQQMGAEIIRQNALIPPIMRKNQGDIINIMVARDLDFSSVYSLRAK